MLEILWTNFINFNFARVAKFLAIAFTVGFVLDFINLFLVLKFIIFQKKKESDYKMEENINFIMGFSSTVPTN